jgi:hypothetical protein
MTGAGAELAGVEFVMSSETAGQRASNASRLSGPSSIGAGNGTFGHCGPSSAIGAACAAEANAAATMTVVSILVLARATNASRRERVKFELNCFQFVSTSNGLFVPIALIVNGVEK